MFYLNIVFLIKQTKNSKFAQKKRFFLEKCDLAEEYKEMLFAFCYYAEKE
jgi:hypothetical protein